MNLLLFDIDGTLLKTEGVGRTSVCQAAKDVFGLEEDLSGLTVSGNTDGGVVREILAKHGLPITEANVEIFEEANLMRLSKNLLTVAGYILPGVVELLDAIDAASHAKGLLTGNIERGARLKLEAYGLGARFEFGAYSDDSFERNKLGPLAKQRAEDRYRLTFNLSDVFVIGDTPRDIACGKAFGARTVAVATGNYQFKELAAHQPDFLFEDLSSTADVLQALNIPNLAASEV